MEFVERFPSGDFLAFKRRRQPQTSTSQHRRVICPAYTCNKKNNEIVCTFDVASAHSQAGYVKGSQGHEKKWFCCGKKIRDKYFFFVAATKNFAAATKRFVDKTKNFIVVTKYFCYPYFNK